MCFALGDFSPPIKLPYSCIEPMNGLGELNRIQPNTFFLQSAQTFLYFLFSKTFYSAGGRKVIQDQVQCNVLKPIEGFGRLANAISSVLCKRSISNTRLKRYADSPVQ